MRDVESAVLRIGVISDTHGVLRPEATAFLRGCSHIVHAGDIGAPMILEELAALAPVTAVRGNNDAGPWADRLRESETLTLEGVRIHVLHDVSRLTLESGGARINVVISGHSHKPVIARREGVLFMNPGSAGPRRFRLPVSIGEVVIDRRGKFDARIEELTVLPGRKRAR